MFGLLSVLTFLGVFIWMGLSEPHWNARTQRRLGFAVALLVLVLFISLNVFWDSKPFSYSSEDLFRDRAPSQ